MDEVSKVEVMANTAFLEMRGVLLKLHDVVKFKTAIPTVRVFVIKFPNT